MKISNIEYKLLPNKFNVEKLINFLFTYGQTKYNWCPEKVVRGHFEKLKSGKIFAWGAFLDKVLVGLITAELGGQFRRHYGKNTSAEIIEFVVHPDHRNTGILMQDAAYMVIVPNIVPETPPLKKNPIFLYVEDRFKKPYPFRKDISVIIDEVIDQKIEALAAHESQMFEWLPWTNGIEENENPTNPDKR